MNDTVNDAFWNEIKRLDEKISALALLHETKFAEAEKRNEQRFRSQEVAVAKAEASNEKRFDSINEFRSQLRDQQATFIPRMEAEKSISSNSEKIAEMAGRIDRFEGRSGGLNAGWTILIGAVGLAAAVIAIFTAVAR